MKTRTLIAVLVSVASLSALAADQRGAKAIFVDTTSGAVVEGTKPRPGAKPQTQKPRRSAAKPSATSAVAASPGLKYYIELVSPTGERRQVTTDYQFRSGDRILLHVESMVDGYIEVYQREPDGTMTALFPDQRINGGSAFIRKGEDTVLPSPTAWFRFDDRAGIEHLQIFLTPGAEGTAAPWQPTTPAQAAHDAIQGAAGSKGLLIETDNSGKEPATYAVAQPGARPGRMSLTILLKHQ
jgi:hypothetical protein